MALKKIDKKVLIGAIAGILAIGSAMNVNVQEKEVINDTEPIQIEIQKEQDNVENQDRNIIEVDRETIGELFAAIEAAHGAEEIINGENEIIEEFKNMDLSKMSQEQIDLIINMLQEKKYADNLDLNYIEDIVKKTENRYLKHIGKRSEKSIIFMGKIALYHQAQVERYKMENPEDFDGTNDPNKISAEFDFSDDYKMNAILQEINTELIIDGIRKNSEKLQIKINDYKNNPSYNETGEEISVEEALNLPKIEGFDYIDFETYFSSIQEKIEEAKRNNSQIKLTEEEWKVIEMSNPSYEILNSKNKKKKKKIKNSQ